MPFFHPSLNSFSSLITLLSFTSSSLAASSTSSTSYSLQTTYAGSSFFSGFDFFTDPDPTHGFVTYVDQNTAQQSGLISAADSSPVIIGVDHTNVYNGNANYWGINGVGRPSVRITSKQKFNHALVVADVAHMPGGVCGTWPALWMLGDGTWPKNGEIDIIEGVNGQQQALTSLHTSGHCNVPGSSPETGIVQTTNCTYDSNTGANAAGCGVLSNDASSFGLNFNSIGGGVYAMEWTSTSIKAWFFRRNAVPSDITSGKPNPSSWGNPYTNFQGDCNIDANFANQQIVVDTTFCGDWAGSVWGDSCQASTGTSSCSNYVGNNPSAFKDMYWAFNSIRVYQTGGNGTATTTSSTVSTTTGSSSTTITTSATSSSPSKISTTTTTTTSTSTTTTRTVATTTTTTTTTNKPSTTTTTLSTTTTTGITTTTPSSATSTRTTASATSSKTTTTITTTTARPTITTTTTKTTVKTTTTTTTTRRIGFWPITRRGLDNGEIDEHGYQPVPRQVHARRNGRPQMNFRAEWLR